MGPATTPRAGSFVTFPIRRGLWGACRVGEVSSACMMVEVKNWFGATPPLLKALVSAEVLCERGARGPPLRFLVLSGKLARGGAVVGFEPKLAHEPVRYNVGLSWRALAAHTLNAWAYSTQTSPEEAIAQEARNAAKRRGLSVTHARLEDAAKEALKQWRDGEYDNHKDAILESRDLLRKTAGIFPKLAARLQNMHDSAIKSLSRLAAEDPEVARYAKGLLTKARR